MNYLIETEDLSETDIKYLTTLARLESGFTQDPKGNNVAFGYFQLTPQTISNYDKTVDIETFKSDPSLQFKLAY